MYADDAQNMSESTDKYGEQCGALFVTRNATRWTFVCTFCQKSTRDIGEFICHIKSQHLDGDTSSYYNDYNMDEDIDVSAYVPEVEMKDYSDNYDEDEKFVATDTYLSDPYSNSSNTGGNNIRCKELSALSVSKAMNAYSNNDNKTNDSIYPTLIQSPSLLKTMNVRRSDFAGGPPSKQQRTQFNSPSQVYQNLTQKEKRKLADRERYLKKKQLKEVYNKKDESTNSLTPKEIKSAKRRLYQRERLQRIKADPEMHKMYKEAERKKYVRRRQKMLEDAIKQQQQKKQQKRNKNKKTTSEENAVSKSIIKRRQMAEEAVKRRTYKIQEQINVQKNNSKKAQTKKGPKPVKKIKKY